jgi:hypothetical protein
MRTAHGTVTNLKVMEMAKAKAKFNVGGTVKFLGYQDDVPADEQVLEEGKVYTVVEVNPEDKSLVLETENPDFNPKKKESESNPQTLMVDVFEDEVEEADEDSEEEADETEEVEEAPKAKAAPAKAKAKAKAAPAEEEADEDEEEEEEEAPKAKAKAKPAAKAKTAAKPAAKAKTAAKPAAKAKVAEKKAAPSSKAEKPEEVEQYPALENEDEEITALVEGAESVLELAEELVEEGAELDYKLGGVLYHVRLSKEYQSLDARYAENGGFGLYVKERLNVEYRKAMYLIDIYYKFNLFGIDAEKVKEIGWTKASKIAAVMSEDNAEELVELAEKSTVADLQDTIKEDYVEKGGSKTAGEKKKRVTFKFRLFEDQASLVTEVLNTVAKDMGVKDLSAAFEHIVAEWAAENLNLKPAAKAKTVAKPAAKAAAPAKKTRKAEVEQDEDE